MGDRLGIPGVVDFSFFTPCSSNIFHTLCHSGHSWVGHFFHAVLTQISGYTIAVPFLFQFGSILFHIRELHKLRYSTDYVGGLARGMQTVVALVHGI